MASDSCRVIMSCFYLGGNRGIRYHRVIESPSLLASDYRPRQIGLPNTLLQEFSVIYIVHVASWERHRILQLQFLTGSRGNPYRDPVIIQMQTKPLRKQQTYIIRFWRFFAIVCNTCRWQKIRWQWVRSRVKWHTRCYAQIMWLQTGSSILRGRAIFARGTRYAFYTFHKSHER